MIITETLQVGGKQLKTGTSKDGKQWKLMSFKAKPFEEYVSVFLPDYIQEGDIITVTGTVKKKETDNYTNFSLQYPVVQKLYIEKSSYEKELEKNQVWTDIQTDRIEGTQIDDTNLPF